MTKEQFIDKWENEYDSLGDDLEAVIAHEIAKVQPEKQNAMVQEKQLRVLFKYIEANWDVVVSQVDKTMIKRIFGGVLCEDIMNDTLHEVKVEPELNPISEAYERGEKIRHKDWHTNSWIKKHSKVHSIDERNEVYKNYSIDFDFDANPQNWELYTEPTEQPSSQAKLDNSFDKDRFERMFCIFALRGDYLNFEQIKNSTEHALKQLDAYYASKEGGANG